MVGTAILGVGLVVSLSGNVVQGVQNRKLRQQVEALTSVSERLQAEIDELQKKYDALRAWSFRKRAETKKEIEARQADLEANRLEIVNLYSQISA